jgi:5-carboxymethyl-2-hydroxymuconate isomerase
VRAYAANASAIADAHPDNAFCDLVLRIGAGRSGDEKTQAGRALLATAQRFFQTLLDAPHFALSLEIIEIDPVLSWKINSIHPRVKKLQE